MTKEHTYPSDYQPGTHWAVDEAWAILDQVPPDAIPDDVRSYLAGLIIGTLLRIKADQKCT